MLDALSRLGFSKYSPLADTTCRIIGAAQFTAMRAQMNATEKTEAAFFWSTNPDQYEIYECLKTPTHHLVLLEKGTNRVLHMIQA